MQVTFRNIPHSDAIEAYVYRRAAKLEKFSRRITRCRVAVEGPHRHHHSGRHFRVRIDLTLPRDEVVVSRAPGDDISNEDVYAAIDHAFDQMGRQLENHIRRRRDSRVPVTR